MTREDYLKELNKAFSDFKFYEDGHYYTYKDKPISIGATGLIEQYTQDFDAQAVAERVAEKQGVSVKDILDEWKLKNMQACLKGSASHNFVQNLWSGISHIEDTKNFTTGTLDALKLIQGQAQNFYNDYKDRLELIYNEYVIGAYEFDLASAIDALFINKLTGGLVLVDYKTNTDIHKNERYAKNMKVPLNHLKDDSLTHYAIQLSIYKYLVEKYTTLEFEEMFIVWFSELNENYEIVEVPYLKEEVIKILESRRVKNMNSIGVLLMGASGTGKSTSLRNLPAKETAIINVTNKPMPFRNKNGLKISNCTNYEQMINAIIKTNKRIIVVDDSSYMMTFENFDKATQKGYDKFTTMAVNYYNLIETPKHCEDEKIVYFITHEEIDENGITHPKSIGKMLSQQLVIEGLFSIVLRSMQKENQYVFQTHNDGTSVCKSPIDMFEEDFIPNDLAEVDKIIREYYGFKPINDKVEEKESEEK